jgi:hypothetical protein
MLYLHYFMVGAWMFAIGCFLGAIYVQNHDEKAKSPRLLEKVEKCTECEAWRVLNAASAAAD